MSDLGLFPLGIVLLPTERIPLHIFEPRYRELIGECLDGGGEFGLVLEDAGGLREVGTRAGVVDLLERFPDGRLNIVIEGRERFRILAETEGRSYRTARVEPYHDLPDTELPGPQAAGVRERAVTLFATIARAAQVELDPVDPDEPVSYTMAGRVELGPPAKQRLLELRSEQERLAELGDQLEELLVLLARRREAGERAGSNGHVSRYTPPADGGAPGGPATS